LTHVGIAEVLASEVVDKVTFEIGQTIYDELQEEEVKVVAVNTSTLPSIYLVKDEKGRKYMLTEDDAKGLEQINERVKK